MSSKRKSAAPAFEFNADATPDEQRDTIYRLQLPAGAKKKKTLDPRDLNAIEVAARKLAKQQDAARLKELGPNPADDLRTEGQRTGLRNLGATCYMNSLLQCLFMNSAFRRGVYEWRPSPEAKAAAAAAAKAAESKAQASTSSADDAVDVDADLPESSAEIALIQLQRLFANLQHSESSVYDPAALVNALQLNVAVQQDAQEFNKLLLSYLESQLSRLVIDTFQGESRYHTQCLHCNKASESSATKYPFYELELNLKKTLQQSLEDYVQVEKLCGGNQYDCSHCCTKRDATRQIALASLPPVLCLQLLRFVYDPYTDNKKKVTDAIEFPEVMDMRPYLFGGAAAANGAAADAPMNYRLTAVLMHTGASAHSGHYTARILEQSNEEKWWSFNDEIAKEEVWDDSKAATKAETTGVTLLKRPNEPGRRIFGSRTAYMLLYARDSTVEDAKRVDADLQAPAELRAEVEAASVALKEAAAEHERGVAELTARQACRKELAEAVAPSLPSSAGDGRWISSAWLRKCLAEAQPTEVGAITNSEIVCAHNEADPRKVDGGGLCLVSSCGFAELKRRYGGGPELLEGGCKLCVQQLYSSRCQETEDAQARDLLQMALVAPPPAEGERGYWVPKAINKRWQAWRSDGETSATKALICEHSMLMPLEKNARLISESAWQQLCALFPESIPYCSDDHESLVQCTICRDGEVAAEVAAKEAKEDARAAKDARNSQRTRLARLLAEDAALTPAEVHRDSDSKAYILDGSWVMQWRAYMQSAKADQPGPPQGGMVCEDHGKLLVRPELCLTQCQYAPTTAKAGNPTGAPFYKKGKTRPKTSAEIARDVQLGSRMCLVTCDEATELCNAFGGDVASLSCCSLRPEIVNKLLQNGELQSMNGETPVFDSSPLVCEVCSATTASETMSALLTFEAQPMYVHLLQTRPSPPANGKENSAAAAAAAAAVGGGVEADAEAAPAAGGSRPRRSSRAGASSKLSVKASSTSTVHSVKLLIYQENNDLNPSQQVLYHDGKPLEDPDATLADCGIVARAMLQLFIDKSVEAENIQDALDMHDRQTTGAKGSKRTIEGGFVGSALLSSAPRPSAPAPAAAADASDAVDIGE